MLVRLALLATIIATVAVAVQNADAWHAVDVQVSATCNPQTGTYDITATIVQSQDWPGAFVKSVTPSSLPGSTAGSRTITIVIGWAATSETQTFTRTVNPSGQCVVVCVPQVVEKIVYVDRPTEVVREVVREVPVEKIVEIPAKPAPCVKPKVPKGATVVHGKGCNYYVTITKVKQLPPERIIVTKIVHDRCPPPPVCCEGKG